LPPCSTTAKPICRRSCRQELLDHYLDCLAGYIDLDRAAFMEHYYAYVYVRILQAMGTYGFRDSMSARRISCRASLCAEEPALARS